MPTCRNWKCRADYSIPLFSLRGLSYTEKSIRKTLCPECIAEIRRFIDKKPSEDRGYWEPIGESYFCWTCKKIDFSFDNSYQDNIKYCQCRNKHLDGLPYPEDLDDGVYDYGEGW